MTSETTTPRGRPMPTKEDIRGLLDSLVGVVSAEPFMSASGEVDHIRVVSTGDVHPGRVIREVESALLTYLDLRVDRGCITVLARGEEPARPSSRAGAGEEPEAGSDPVGRESREGRYASSSEALRDGRLILEGHRLASSRSRDLEVSVDIRWGTRTFTGTAETRHGTTDRFQTFANATLDAVRKVVADACGDEAGAAVSLSLAGVQRATIFGREFVAVSVGLSLHRISQELYGTVPVGDSGEEAAVLATLQAVDRRLRAILEGRIPEFRGVGPRAGARTVNPFEIWG